MSFVVRFLCICITFIAAFTAIMCLARIGLNEGEAFSNGMVLIASCVCIIGFSGIADKLKAPN